MGVYPLPMYALRIMMNPFQINWLHLRNSPLRIPLVNILQKWVTAEPTQASTRSTALTAAGITPVCPTISGFAKVRIVQEN